MVGTKNQGREYEQGTHAMGQIRAGRVLTDAPPLLMLPLATAPPGHYSVYLYSHRAGIKILFSIPFPEIFLRFYRKLKLKQF